MSAQGLLYGSDNDLFYNIAQDPNINNDINIFRPEDTNFGVKTNAEMLLIAGLEHQFITNW